MNLKKLFVCGLALGIFAVPGATCPNVFAAEATADATSNAAKKNPLVFDAANGVRESFELNGKPIACRAYRNIVYVKNPKNAEYESMNIFIPEAYFSGGTINGYTANTAPIFLPNNVGGYMPGELSEPGANDRMTGGANAILVALSRGLVVASPAIRGRTTTDAAGNYVGKAPALIVDYKAAVRYLRFNQKNLPAGDTEKIISNGTSAGGALSSLLGATGNSADYAPYLDEIGAADERDDIFAAMAYCPITNLEHADMAYEWIFNGVNEYHQGRQPMPPADADKKNKPPKETRGDKNSPDANRPDNAPMETAAASRMDADAITASAELKKMFPAYLNGLCLTDDDGKPLTLDENGDGSFKAFIESYYIASAQKALDGGEDLSALDWLTIKNGKVTGMNLKKYAVYATRLKATPAFDKFDLSSGENDEFGTTDNTPRHFTEYSLQKSTKESTIADANMIRLLNPMNYIGKDGVTTAHYWRIRHGAIDRDTSLAVPAMLARKLAGAGSNVDFASPWGKGHAGDYDLDELFDWIDKICKQ